MLHGVKQLGLSIAHEYFPPAAQPRTVQVLCYVIIHSAPLDVYLYSIA